MVQKNILNTVYKYSSILLFFFLMPAGILHAQISPGDLTNAHAKFEGMSNCTKCHVLGQGVENSKCLDCHEEIKNLMDAGRGYHSSSEVKGKNCWSCHSEHHGRTFRIINFNENGFDHNKAGFELSGKHSSIKCSECHQQKFISPDAFSRNSKTYLGLSQNCFSCHEDVHRGTLGVNCGNCHDTKNFKPALKFDHNNAKYKLTGSHQEVKCIKCHEIENKEGKKFQKFTGLIFNNCSPCHRDVHRGKFGNDCKKCHVTTSFKSINEKTFDHSKTNYPLLGKHLYVKCNDCHKQGMKTTLKYQKCTDCHADYHKGEFTVNGILRDCSDCHNVDGFQPSIFTLQMHNKTEFKLTGAHLAIPCQKCHYKNKKWNFKTTSAKCIDCHDNVHGNEITKKYMVKNECQSCHETNSWNKINFDHNKTDFALLGKHKSISCGDCHYKTNINNKKVYKFASLKSNCEICHKDIHFGQFNQGDNTDCQKCHTFDNWKADKFNHEKTKFSLAGAHSKLPCYACHKTVNESGNLFVQYKLKDFRCAVCHS